MLSQEEATRQNNGAEVEKNSIHMHGRIRVWFFGVIEQGNNQRDQRCLNPTFHYNL